MSERRSYSSACQISFQKCCTLYLDLVFLIGSVFMNSLAIPGEMGASSSSHLPGFVILSAPGDHREAVDSQGGVTSLRTRALGKDVWDGSKSLQVPDRLELQSEQLQYSITMPSEM